MHLILPCNDFEVVDWLAHQELLAQRIWADLAQTARRFPLTLLVSI